MRYVIFALLATASFLLPSRAHANVPASSDLRGYTDRVARAWVPYVSADGQLADGGPSDSSTRYTGYGAGMMAYVMLRAGQRAADRALIELSLRMAARQASLRPQTPFDLWALTLLYQYAQMNTPDDPAWRAAQPQLAEYLSGYRGMPVSTTSRSGSCSTTAGCYSNWQLVDAQATARLLTLGLHGRPGGYLSDPRAARQRVMTVIRRQAATAAGPPAASTWMAGGRVLSDPPHNPLAYHLFSLVQLQQLNRQAPDLLGTQGQRQLTASARWLLAFAAPDGDVSYMGRSGGQSWVAAAQVLAGAGLLDSSPDASALLDAGWSRLRRQHPLTADGRIPLTAAMASRWSYLGTDPYSGMAVYNALTLLLLNDAADQLDRAPAASQNARLPAAARNGWTSDVAGSGTVAVRHGRMWAAIQIAERQRDLRYARGLLSVKRERRGVWRDVLAARGACQDPLGAAPRLRTRSGRTLHPVWARSNVRGANVTLRGFWATATGTRVRAATWTVKLSDQAVTMTVPARRGETVIAAQLVPASSRVSAGRVQWRGGQLRVTGAQITLSASTCGASSHAQLKRAVWTVRVTRQPVNVVIR